MPAVGRTEESWRKHELLESVASSFIAAGNAIAPGQGIGIDMHAGDAKGVPHPQADFFNPNLSTTTPEVFERLSSRFGMPVLLCEKVRERRASLEERFPQFSVIGNHAGAPSHISGLERRPSWGVCIADPNGHGNAGIEHMGRLSSLIPRLDFVIVYPHGSIERHLAVKKDGCDTRHKNAAAIAGSRRAVEKYEWLRDPNNPDRNGKPLPSLELAARLGRNRMAVTPVLTPSPGFQYRIVVISNYLPDGVTRNRLFGVIR